MAITISKAKGGSGYDYGKSAEQADVDAAGSAAKSGKTGRVTSRENAQITKEDLQEAEKILATIANVDYKDKNGSIKAPSNPMAFANSSGGLLSAPANLPDPIAAEYLLLKLQTQLGNEDVQNSRNDISYNGQVQNFKRLQRIEERKKMQEAEQKAATMKIVGQVFGWLGVIVSAIAAVLVGTLASPAAAIPLIMATVATATLMGVEQSGVIEQAMKDKSPQEKAGVTYGLMALMLVINIAGAVASGGLSAAPTIAAKLTQTAVSTTAEVAADAAQVSADIGQVAGEAATSALTAGAEEGATIAEEVAELGVDAGVGVAKQVVKEAAEEAVEETVEEAAAGAARTAGKETAEETAKDTGKAAAEGVKQTSKLKKVGNALFKSPLYRMGGSAIKAGTVAQRVGNLMQGTISITSAGVGAGGTAYTYDAAMTRAESKKNLAQITKMMAMDEQARDRIQELIDRIDKGFVNFMRQLSDRDGVTSKIISRIGKA